ncbi:unnamed protein product [Linum trigynum]|uniref:V-type proton ATPase proteolipid subunit n=1 Tax=Linum trigynum TaxID=586398 RepID=A0AAV2F441_9ROSI
MASTFSGDETAPFFGFLGASFALVFSCMGAAYGTAESGVGVASMGVMRLELVMKSIVPVVMAGVEQEAKMGRIHPPNEPLHIVEHANRLAGESGGDQPPNEDGESGEIGLGI